MFCFLSRNSCIKHRGIAAFEVRLMCDVAVEDWKHDFFFLFRVLFKCGVSVCMWLLSISHLLAPFFSWLRDFIKNVGRIVPIILWKLWCSRNFHVFDDTMQFVDVTCAQVLSLIQHVSLGFGSNIIEYMQWPNRIVWSRPHEWIVVLNVNGSVFSSVGVVKVWSSHMW